MIVHEPYKWSLKKPETKTMKTLGHIVRDNWNCVFFSGQILIFFFLRNRDLLYIDNNFNCGSIIKLLRRKTKHFQFQFRSSEFFSFVFIKFQLIQTQTLQRKAIDRCTVFFLFFPLLLFVLCFLKRQQKEKSQFIYFFKVIAFYRQ